jgi:beta-lactam-binding protein with PASTA domain
MSWGKRIVAIGAAAAGALALAACGSSSTANLTAVPVTKGLTVQEAAAVLCKAGLRVHGSVYIPGLPVLGPTMPPEYNASPAHRRALAEDPTVAATNPPGGGQVARGASVTMILTGHKDNLTIVVPTGRCAPIKPHGGTT